MYLNRSVFVMADTFPISPWEHMLWYSLEAPQALLMNTHNIPYVFLRNKKNIYLDTPLESINLIG